MEFNNILLDAQLRRRQWFNQFRDFIVYLSLHCLAMALWWLCSHIQGYLIESKYHHFFFIQDLDIMAQDEHEDFSLTCGYIPSNILASIDVMDHMFQGGNVENFRKRRLRILTEMATINSSN